jgi:hypothetical protein
METITPKEIAIRIYNKYMELPMHTDRAKLCSLIAVDEIIINMNVLEENGKLKKGFNKFEFWLEVKKEINLL